MAANLKEAQECMAFYRRNNEDYDDKWDEMYWSLDLYDLSQPHTPEEAWEFRRPEYTFIAEPGGELQYYRHHVSRRMNDEFNVDEFAFGKVTCNLPVPYQPGDILKIDCRPYAPGPVYCVIAEVGDDCCGVQCFYRCGIRCCNPEKMLRIEHGALKYGHYFSGYLPVLNSFPHYIGQRSTMGNRQDSASLWSRWQKAEGRSRHCTEAL